MNELHKAILLLNHKNYLQCSYPVNDVIQIMTLDNLECVATLNLEDKTLCFTNGIFFDPVMIQEIHEIYSTVMFEVHKFFHNENQQQ